MVYWESWAFERVSTSGNRTRARNIHSDLESDALTIRPLQPLTGCLWLCLCILVSVSGYICLSLSICLSICLCLHSLTHSLYFFSFPFFFFSLFSFLLLFYFPPVFFFRPFFLFFLREIYNPTPFTVRRQGRQLTSLTSLLLRPWSFGTWLIIRLEKRFFKTMCHLQVFVSRHRITWTHCESRVPDLELYMRYLQYRISLKAQKARA